MRKAGRALQGTRYEVRGTRYEVQGTSYKFRCVVGVRRGRADAQWASLRGAGMELVGRRGHDPALRGAEWESGWRAADCRPFPHRTRRGAYYAPASKSRSDFEDFRRKYNRDCPRLCHFAAKIAGRPMGSDPTAAGGGRREGSEGQRSARDDGASAPRIFAGHRNRASLRGAEVKGGRSMIALTVAVLKLGQRLSQLR